MGGKIRLNVDGKKNMWKKRFVEISACLFVMVVENDEIVKYLTSTQNYNSIVLLDTHTLLCCSYRIIV